MPTDFQEIVIRPPRRLQAADLLEVWRQRGLLLSLAARQTRERFNDLYLGIFWSVARPLAMLAVFATFRDLSQAQTGVTIPYAVYLFSGLILWFYFVEVTTRAAKSLDAAASLLKKVYIPRLIPPLTPGISYLADLGVGLLITFVIMYLNGVGPGWRIVLLPLTLLVCMTLSFGIGLLFASLSQFSNDWNRALALVLYVGLFVSPVIFSPDLLPEKAKLVFNLNPMSGVLMGFRANLVAGQAYPWALIGYAAAFSVVLVGAGLFLFRRTEQKVLDNL